MKHQINGVIVFFSFPCGPLGLLAKLLCNTDYVISLRGGDVPGTEKKLDRIHKILQPLRRLIFKKSKQVVANSKGLRQLAQKADPVAVSIIPNGIDTDFFVPATRKSKSPVFKLMFTGRISEQKNLMFLVDQLSVFKKKQKKKLRLQIAGDGPLKNKIQDYAKNLDVSDQITWHGWVDKKKILSLCQEADCFINPSLYEGMPNAVLEAMACGIPIIASQVAGNSEVVLHGKTGFLFRLDDETSLQEALEKVSADPGLCQTLGKNARDRAEKDFSWTMVAKKYALLF
ncbi:MAG: glycosyltransferase family 4 protein [Desulfobacula sp.]|nr:glycosyltransferase family 4 protein [Desulfobacula sp.]